MRKNMHGNMAIASLLDYTTARFKHSTANIMLKFCSEVTG